MRRVFAFHPSLRQPLRKRCYYRRFTDVVTETQAWRRSPKDLTQACPTPERPGVTGPGFILRALGGTCAAWGRLPAQPLASWPRPVAPSSLACAELWWPVSSAQALHDGSVPLWVQLVFSSQQSHSFIKVVWTPQALQGHCCTEERPPSTRVPPGSRLSSLPFSVARRSSGGSWRDTKVTPGCLQKDVSEQKPD